PPPNSSTYFEFFIVSFAGRAVRPVVVFLGLAQRRRDAEKNFLSFSASLRLCAKTFCYSISSME
ncbi:MAG: hypothetical protein WC869_17050, partial [Phycisphaerae bacterium]